MAIVGSRPIAVVGLVAALCAALLGALSGIMYRLEWLVLGAAFDMLRWAAYGGAAAMVVSVIALILALPGGPRRGLWSAVAGLVIATAAFWIPFSQQRLAQRVPAIHDITTDTSDPPEFRAVLPLRAKYANSPRYGGEDLARQQRRAYPDVAPAVFQAPLLRVFEAALATARDMGWRIVAASPEEARIEAVSTTFWFGFRDDIVVRIRDTGSGIRVDIRSASRIGVSDVGKNAARITEFMKALKSRVQAA